MAMIDAIRFADPFDLEFVKDDRVSVMFEPGNSIPRGGTVARVIGYFKVQGYNYRNK
tara:strand:- start:191 stop:361 length:171 start_codon:yes stop_codon:yes gene_type:complete